MKTFEHSIEQMNQLLDELIQAATYLREMSLRVISREELDPLQKRQEELLSDIESLDQYIQQHFRHQMTDGIKERFHDQLALFQTLNHEFIKNLRASQGLIQFDLHKNEEQEGQDFSILSRFNIISSSPKSAKAIKTEEEKEG